MQEDPNLRDVIARLDRAISKVGLMYALIGGAAVVLRGHDRATQDVDAVVLGADEKLDDLLQAFASEGLELRATDGKLFALRHRMILLRTPDGLSADISMGILPFEIDIVDRTTQEVVFENLSVPVASAEDLIIMKMIASRPQDIDDVRRLVEIHKNLNAERIESIVRDYADALEQPEIIKNLELLSRHGC